ncbi:hypothetical protein L1987_08736 [Smallanthus sonchifolius]|uniref:Uncharacterized protein n=1 Tax=Smallanthus sonchifolius TaxID=185202 RepID=A0ACB9JM15_9ASTR|nr:hypothetical protein L1987_08736 [Smallanthus sonchifolius]
MKSNLITMLNELDAKDYDFTIKVRVIRMWRNVNKKNPKDSYSIEMIVVDEQGTRMHATCQNVIGSVVRCFDTAKKVGFHGMECKRRTMQIEDPEGNSIYVTLFDEYEEQFSKYTSENKDVTTIVIILQFGRLQWFGGKPYVSNTYKVTRLFVNDDIDEINLFKKRCSKKVLRKVITIPKGDGSDEFEEQNVFECLTPKCAQEAVSAEPRIKLGIRVQDATGMISLTLFDGEANRIFRKSTKEFLEKYLEGGYNRLLPDEFYDLMDKKYAFKIEITDFNLKTGKQVYTIAKMTDDSSIIGELEIFFTSNEVDDYASMNAMSVDVQSQETDVVSFCGDNGTPISDLDKNPGKRPCLNEKKDTFKADNELKRSLCHIYDVDEEVSFSAMKARPTGAGNVKRKSMLIDNATPIVFDKENVTTHISIPYPNHGVQFIDRNRDMRSPLSNITIDMSTFNGNRITNESDILHCYNHSKVLSNSNTSTFTPISASSTRPSRTRKLKRNTLNIPPFPNMDLTLQEEVIDGQIIKNNFAAISKDYLDHGEQSVICKMCNAKLWSDEVVKGAKPAHKSSYSLCCAYGKVQLPEYKQAPTNLINLYRSGDSKSNFFIKSIRRYNSIFSFTSMGGKIDRSINRGSTPSIFRLSGQNYHCMGSLLPSNGSKPKFSQLYIYDTENEISNRQIAVGQSKNGTTSTSEILDLQIIHELKVMLDSENELVKSYRMVRDCFHNNPQVDLKLRLIGKRQQDGRTYNLPTASEVAALIVGDIGDSFESRDIIVKTQSGALKRISELHPSYLALQYPLLFPYGDDGYRVDIPHRDVTDSMKGKRQNCTMREFFAYRIQDRVNSFSLILNARRLFQQFLVDAYTMIESERLYFIRRQQQILRCESYENLRNAQKNGNTDISNVGQRVILPSSFTGGARYMMQNYLDAMSLCKWFGYPDFFITITCNPKWPEVKRFLKDRTIKPEDRPDILCRLFKIKLDSFVKDLKENAILGQVQAVVYTVEFQKRGLPHAHVCLFMHPDHKLPTVEYIDPIISVEIPEKNEDPELYSLVKEFMIHGPCGNHNLNCPCMIDNKCSKKFPKRFCANTTIDGDGFPIYRRRDYGTFVEKSGVKLDNRSVVPYNKLLLKRYQAHINVEWCNQAGSIKYLFKYINKGPDRATLLLEQSNKEDDNNEVVDEIQEYYDCRYLSACEATWRIFSFDIHYRTPSVMRLPFHLPGQQQVVYGADDDIENVLTKESVASSMFLSWMKCNATNDKARKLTYVEFPTQFVWKKKERSWEPRRRGFSIGRIHSVSPSLGEAYFLRILLNKVRGPISFEEILTVNGHKCSTFRDACYKLGLLDDDTEYIEAIEEASHSGSGYFLRSLFATMLLSGSLSRPDFVWQNTWKFLSDGILYKQQLLLKYPGLSLTDDRIQNLTLFEIEKLLLRNSSSLRRFPSMPYPDNDSISSSNNRLITEELSYDRNNLQTEFDSLLVSLTDEQRSVFEEIMNAVKHNKGGVFFVYGYGGTGKTFLWRTLSAAIRCKGQIVLNVASSGIASLLLTGGRTAHSRFLIPLNLNEVSLCYIKPGSDVAHLLQQASLIIWDEAPMIHKHAFEALDRTMKDILMSDEKNNSEMMFGGKGVLKQ